ncbi:MAG: TetR/AcrR family transcriptional regulator [Sinobacteraceae bacterium]|nr:TetR/AcrR family transcriptional regulator [Nevskiaceae bacterium]
MTAPKTAKRSGSAAKARQHAPRRSREAREEQILAVSRDLFSQHGFEGTAVAEIARHVGVVEGLVYKYFPTKRTLLLKTLEYWYDGMFGDYTRELSDFPGYRDRLRYLIWRHLCTVRDSPRLCALMFHEVMSAEHDYRGSALHALNQRYTQLLMDTLQAGVEAGEFRSDLPTGLVRSLVYGGIQHESSTYVASFITRRPRTRAAKPLRLDTETLADQITTLLCEGLRRVDSAA